MPVSSYIVFPVKEKFDQVFLDLSQEQYCQLYPSKGKELMVLVSDTPCLEVEKELVEKVESNQFIQCLSMTFGQIQESKG